MFRSHTMASVAVAEATYAAMQKGKALVVPGMRNRLLAVMTRLVPVEATARVARRILEDVPAAGRR